METAQTLASGYNSTVNSYPPTKAALGTGVAAVGHRIYSPAASALWTNGPRYTLDVNGVLVRAALLASTLQASWVRY